MAKSLTGYALELNPTTQIVCAYASGSKSLRAYSGVDRWIVIGSFRVPENVQGARLQVEGLVTPNAACSVCLFDPQQIVGSLVTMTADRRERQHVSLETFELLPTRLYQVAARVTTGAQADSRFAVVRTVSLV